MGYIKKDKIKRDVDEFKNRVKVAKDEMENQVKDSIDDGLNWLQKLWRKIKEFFKNLF